MIRQLRRTLRQWKGELGAFWGRFNTFFRIVFGIVLAMIVVYGARRYFLDEQSAAVKALRTELTEAGAPEVVPSPEADNDVQEALLQAESLQTSLERERQATRQALDAPAVEDEEPSPAEESDRPVRTRAQASETIETLGRLIGKHGLTVRNAARTDCLDEFPVPRICQSYHLVGSFPGIHAFLRDVQAMDEPCRLRRVAISLPEADRGASPTSAEVLTLTFHLESLYVD